MQRSQFKRRLKRARRASKRLANDRSQRLDGSARWAATMAERQRPERFATAERPDRVTPTNDLIGRT